MATFIDVTGIAAFSRIFVFVILFIGAYVFFKHTHWFQHEWIAWIIALAVSLLIVVSDTVTNIVTNVTPWLAVLMFLAIFVLMAGKVLGTDVEEFPQAKAVFFIVLVLVFLVGTLAYLRSQLTAPGDVDEEGNLIQEQDYITTRNFIFHPKFMGIIFVLLVAIFTVALMAGNSVAGGQGGGH
ncbi:hypothetical protein J4419_05925 [Candidatus Woesearchaeota archaeon]|nr:hypothetical protein [Candidatus Woesearchaeota archaeon]